MKAFSYKVEKQDYYYIVSNYDFLDIRKDFKIVIDFLLKQADRGCDLRILVRHNKGIRSVSFTYEFLCIASYLDILANLDKDGFIIRGYIVDTENIANSLFEELHKQYMWRSLKQ